MDAHVHPRLDATMARRNATTVRSCLFAVETRSKAAMQTNDPMIPGPTIVVTPATLITEAAVVGGEVTMTVHRATMIVGTVIMTEDTVVDATTTAVVAMTTGGTRAAHMSAEPYTVEYRPRFLFSKPVPFFPRALGSRPIVLAFLYVFNKLSLDVNTIGF